jgi:hypothetical protein
MRHSFAKKVLLLYSVLSVTVCNSRCDARKEYCTLHYDRIRKPTNISYVGAGATRVCAGWLNAETQSLPKQLFRLAEKVSALSTYTVRTGYITV